MTGDICRDPGIAGIVEIQYAPGLPVPVGLQVIHRAENRDLIGGDGGERDIRVALEHRHHERADVEKHAIGTHDLQAVAEIRAERSHLVNLTGRNRRDWPARLDWARLPRPSGGP